jgi:integrase
VRGVYFRSGVAYIRYLGADGRIIRESTKQSTAKVAEDLLKTRRALIFTRQKFPQREFERVKFGELLDYWWEKHGKNTRSDFQYILPRIREQFGGRKAREITADNVEDWLISLKDVRGLSSSTVNHHRTIINSAFRFACRRQRFDGNPVAAVPQMKEPESRNFVISPERFRALLEQCEIEGHEVAVAVLVLGTTTLRKMELLARQWADVDVDGESPCIRVPYTKTGRSKTVPLADVAVTALHTLPSFQRNDYLFPSRSTTRWPDPKQPFSWDIGKPFRAAAARAGLKGLRIHDLRHLGISILLLRGTPDAVAAKLTGHRKLLERYQHLSPEFRKATVDLIAAELTTVRALTGDADLQPSLSPAERTRLRREGPSRLKSDLRPA